MARYRSRTRGHTESDLRAYLVWCRERGVELVVIAFRDADGDLHGINAWPATGVDLKFYREGTNNG